MDSAHNIADSTDWLNTPLAALSDLENALHCQICKEFYDTPMITSCSHTFCSKCIRTSLSADGRCPACRTSDQANKLRNNWQLQEVVATFVAARPQALKVAREEREQEQRRQRTSKRKRTVLDDDEVTGAQPTGRTTRQKSRRIAASQESQPDAIEIDDSDGDFQPEAPREDGMAECPLGCGKRMKIDAVEPHLDRCEDEKLAEKRAKSRTPVAGLGGSRSSTRGTPKPQDRISELNYSLLKELALRKKFDELGIPNTGPKQLLVRRHTEWVNIWNANCDSNHPRSKRELLHDLDVWERTQGGKAPQVNLGPAMLRKDFDGQAWASKNKDDFSRLIADARRKKNNPTGTSTPDATPAEGKTAEETGESTAEAEHSSDNAMLDTSPPQAQVNGTTVPSPGTTVPPSRQDEEAPPSHQQPLSHNIGDHDRPAENGVPTPPDQNGTSILAGDTPLSPPSNEHLPSFSQPHLATNGSRSPVNSDQHFATDRTAEPRTLPTHVLPGPVKKVPVFEVPGEHLKDMDAGQHGP